MRYVCMSTANLKFLPRGDRPLVAGKPLWPSLARRHSTNCFPLQKTCALAVERRKFPLKFASLAFLRSLWCGPQQRPLARSFLSSTLIGPFKIRGHAQIQQPLALTLKFKPVLWVVSHVTETSMVVKDRMRDRKLIRSRQRSLSSRFILPCREKPLLAGKAHGYRNRHKYACSLMSTAGQIHYNSFPLRPVFYKAVTIHRTIDESWCYLLW